MAAAGYATDPGYASKLIQIMDSYNLYQYDELKEDEEMSAEDKQKNCGAGNRAAGTEGAAGRAVCQQRYTQGRRSRARPGH
ncbi:hypothetical protein ACFTAO_19925 [Paenibacillus rhizoplanae]